MSNPVNFYEFIEFVTFNIAVHELIFVYSFLLARFLVSKVPRATVRTLKPTKPKNLKKLRFLCFTSSSLSIAVVNVQRSIQDGIRCRYRGWINLYLRRDFL